MEREGEGERVHFAWKQAVKLLNQREKKVK
jgi:hypothetical protein